MGCWLCGQGDKISCKSANSWVHWLGSSDLITFDAQIWTITPREIKMEGTRWWSMCFITTQWLEKQQIKPYLASITLNLERSCVTFLHTGFIRSVESQPRWTNQSKRGRLIGGAVMQRFRFDSQLTSSGLRPTRMCLWSLGVTVSPPLYHCIQPVKLTLKQTAFTYLQSSRRDYRDESWGSLTFSPLRYWKINLWCCHHCRGRENHIYYTGGPQWVCLQNLYESLSQEIANQSLCLFSGSASSQASVSHSCIGVWMCVSYNLGKKDTRREEPEVRSATGHHCFQLFVLSCSESSSAWLLLHVKQVMLWSFSPGRQSDTRWLLVITSQLSRFMTLTCDFRHLKNLKAGAHLLRVSLGVWWLVLGVFF